MLFSSIFRLPSRKPVHSMLDVRSTGHYKVSENWHDGVLRKNFLQLFWLVDGQLKFEQEKQTYLLEKNQVCFYLPGDLHKISSLSLPTEYYWLTIDGPDLEFVVEKFQIVRSPMYAGLCPINLFRNLQIALRSWSPAASYQAGSLAYEIISRAFAGIYKEDEIFFQKYRQHIQENFHISTLSVEDSAAALNCHRSTLIRLVKKHCGVTPVKYLQNFRMQEALYLLKDTR